MKKALAMILALTMALSLVACGAKEETKTETPSTSTSTSTSTPEQKPETPKTDWPNREVRLIIPYGEGGGSHKVSLVIKEVADKLGLMKKPFIAVCMPNAATLEGQEEVLYADPDGYTILMHHNAMLNGYALGKQDFTYDSFKTVGQIYETPLAIAVRSDFPADDLKGLVAEIQANPGKYSWTWAGAGGNTHFASYAFYNAAGLDPAAVTPCVTKSDGDSVVQLLGKTADITIAQTNAYEEYVKSGDIKVLGVSSEKPVTVGGKEVATWKSQGFDATYNLRFLGFVPKDTPDEVVDAISAVMKEITNSPEFAEKMAAQGIVPAWLDPADALAAFEETGKAMVEIAKLMG